ncbi:MAG: cysteine--tRNA ligase, partial [Candidatus Paceibacterota bacterium]
MIQLYNTLTKQKENFAPIKAGEVSMYHCGPTVYNYAHLGNLRAYVFADLLRRVFEYENFKVKQVVNITDVGQLVSDADSGEDKMTKALKREGKPLTLEAMAELANFYTQAFVSDLRALNILTPDYLPKASEHINDDIEVIKKLETKGFTYKTSDGIYFAVGKLPTYGKLGGLNQENKQARISANLEKQDQRDFTLWKFDGQIGWESPWGKGFPGWHIECSAMSEKYLGQPFDIHTGGIDHIPVHHNNEIAQSEAANDKPLANFWLHSAFLTLAAGEKMAKSEDNFLTIDSLLKLRTSPLAYRYLLLTTHYRSPLNFSVPVVTASEVALGRLRNFVSGIKSAGKIEPNYQKQFNEFISDDLDLPKALALAWELVKDDKISAPDKKATLLDFDRVFGLTLDRVETFEIPTA